MNVESVENTHVRLRAPPPLALLTENAMDVLPPPPPPPADDTSTNDTSSVVPPVLSFRILLRGAAKGLGRPPGAKGIVGRAIWAPKPRARTDGVDDEDCRVACIFGACGAQHRPGIAVLQHALREHPVLVLDGGHAVAVGRLGYDSKDAAVDALMLFSSSIGARWRRIGAHGSGDSFFECAARTTRRADVNALHFALRSALAREGDAAARPVAPGDTTASDVRRRTHLREEGIGRVPPASCDVCPARGHVFFSDSAWRWEILSIHTHALSPDDVWRIEGEELAERAARFVFDTGGSSPSTVLLKTLLSEKRSVTATAVAMAVSRAARGVTARDVPRSVPCALSVLRLLNMEHVRELFVAVCLPGSARLVVPRAARPPSDNSRGAAAAYWHQDVGCGEMTLPDSAYFAVLSDSAAMSRLAVADLLVYDSSYGYVENAPNASLGALLTIDSATGLAAPGAFLLLGDQSAQTLVAALSSLDGVMKSKGLHVKASVFLQDNAYKDWAAFCFVFSSLLWRSLCLVRLLRALVCAPRRVRVTR